MIRLFLKLYGPLLLAIVIISFAQSRIFGYVAYRYGSENVRLSFLGVFNLVERELGRVDASLWDTAFEPLRRDFGHPVSLSSATKVSARFAPGDARAQLLGAGSVVIWAESDRGYSVARRIGTGDRVLILTFTESRHIPDNLAKLNAVVQWVVLTLLLVFWVWPLLRDMRRLQLAARDIGAGRFDSPPVVGRWSVLADMQKALSAMARQVAALLQSQKALTSGISHELRNPLMRIQYRHRLAQDAPSLESKDAYLAAMQDDLDNMNGLVDEVLEFSKMEYQDKTLKRIVEPVAPMIERQKGKFASQAQVLERQVTLEVSATVDACHLDVRLMERAVGNLLSNAARFAAARVALTVSRDGNWNEIAVEDDGPGIAPADAERVFRPFERLDESRDRLTGGFGLGLAIVREVARLHGGSVSARRGVLGGACFIIRWPEER